MKTDGIWGDDDNCTDDDTATGLVDSYGDSCADWYDAYPGDCGTYDSTTFVANTLCCGCGGGTTVINEDVWTDAYLA